MSGAADASMIFPASGLGLAPPGRPALALKMVGKHGPHPVPGFAIDDRLVLAGMYRAAMSDIAGVDGGLENGVELTPREWPASKCAPGRGDARGCKQPIPFKLLLHQPHIAEDKVATIDVPDKRGMIGDDLRLWGLKILQACGKRLRLDRQLDVLDRNAN